MFTGLVEAVGTVKSLRRKGAAGLLTVELAEIAPELTPGESVSVSGACLTVTAVTGAAATFDCVAETLERTKLGDLAPGSRVNIERALRPQGRLGGHFVTGHIDGLAVVKGMAPSDKGNVLEATAPPELLEFVVEKGSVALDGVSLTVASVTGQGFTVALVPFTLEHTTLGSATPGERLNMETDLLGKYVKRFLSGGEAGGMTEGFLAEHGFM